MIAPTGWQRRTLADVARWGSGGTPAAGNEAFYGGHIPWAVIGDLTDGVVNTTAKCITQAGLEASSAKWVPEGAVLVAMYGSIGKLGIAGRALATNQAIAFAVPGAEVDGKFLFYYLMSQRRRLDEMGKGATQRNISQTILKPWPIVMPQDLGEQRRVVDILEDHLSHLDAATSSVAQARRRGKVLVKAILTDLIPDEAHYPGNWARSTVGMAGRIGLGRQRHPDWHTGPNMRPYLKVANVFEDRIDTSVVMEMHWPDDTFERFRLSPGDILLNEGRRRTFWGALLSIRAAPEVAFTNSLIRFVAGVSLQVALLVFRRHMHAGRFKRESRIDEHAHLSAARLKDVEFDPSSRNNGESSTSQSATRRGRALSAHAGIVERRSGVMGGRSWRRSSSPGGTRTPK